MRNTLWGHCLLLDLYNYSNKLNLKMKSLIISIIKYFYNNFVRPVVRKVNKRISSQIPKTDLSKIHINNAKLLLSREELLTLLPKGGVVAELGVDEGGFSDSILKLNKPQKLHLIDIWGSKRYGDDKKRKVENRFKEKIEDNSVVINLGLSTEVAKDFQDSYFDWIYIDTAHIYKTTIEELELYRTKIKSGGYIAGHDFIIGEFNGMVRYGVKEAVYEFCVKYDWEIVYLTTELKNHPSFAIRKIADSTII